MVTPAEVNKAFNESINVDEDFKQAISNCSASILERKRLEEIRHMLFYWLKQSRECHHRKYHGADKNKKHTETRENLVRALDKCREFDECLGMVKLTALEHKIIVGEYFEMVLSNLKKIHGVIGWVDEKDIGQRKDIGW